MTTETPSITTTTDDIGPTWEPVCRYDDLRPECGVAAYLGGGESAVQVAVFRLADGEVLAVQHHDPYSGANVVARGIVGTRGGEPTVAGPIYKQVFSLRTGECLAASGRSPRPGEPTDLATFDVLVRDGVVHLARAR
ncbi:ferredoxin [Paraoerskovia sediminicola]|uniref:Ferredoxin n=1 Tax=Paraoerskovia sediminicola TaxID=1138587 RepID=A0ABM8G0A0_9CELL|nr:nitrite reductase small subunit NirD [Paraoerskovia sediminicola]BDZ41492.1 ferredoxin [Paraoerskovia sediminicola]